MSWLVAEWSVCRDTTDIEHLVDQEISPALVRALYQGSGPGPSRYVVRRQQADLIIERLP